MVLTVCGGGGWGGGTQAKRCLDNLEQAWQLVACLPPTGSAVYKLYLSAHSGSRVSQAAANYSTAALAEAS